MTQLAALWPTAALKITAVWLAGVYSNRQQLQGAA